MQITIFFRVCSVVRVEGEITDFGVVSYSCPVGKSSIIL